MLAFILAVGNASVPAERQLKALGLETEVLRSKRHADPIEGIRLAHARAWERIASTGSGFVFEQDVTVQVQTSTFVSTIAMVKRHDLEFVLYGSCLNANKPHRRLFDRVYAYQSGWCTHAYYTTARFARAMLHYPVASGDTSEIPYRALAPISSAGVLLPPMFVQDVWKIKSSARSFALSLHNANTVKCDTSSNAQAIVAAVSHFAWLPLGYFCAGIMAGTRFASFFK
jgi:hypothetical protein